MAKRFSILLVKDDNDVLVVVERNSRFYDEVSFHESERNEIVKYMSELIVRVLDELGIKKVVV